MKTFSNVDVIGRERALIYKQKPPTFLERFLQPRAKDPVYEFTFFVPEYLYIRAKALTEDIGEEYEGRYTVGGLARALYTDFWEYYKKTNDIHDIYKRLQARRLAPTVITPYESEAATQGVLFEEQRGFVNVVTRIPHKKALRGEFLLRDMLEIYPDHDYTLEDILEIVFCDFMHDYRRGLIKNPIPKLAQYF